MRGKIIDIDTLFVTVLMDDSSTRLFPINSIPKSLILGDEINLYSLRHLYPNDTSNLM
ncbi:hypothetical protein [Oceanirhabdus sp. W0125-5]|uniref:hypothetical protein n=1 Tax=Oceanirhabdus sp. W0125-5 TaxID=2999116 RepID=UPI0022F2BB02|nr:hypothetical protein [Oceanirhabdus sp. W0125-5]WBW98298.1 hypothetical protein OW730_05880 [Oceanirhabdus sp. W0125-5]